MIIMNTNSLIINQLQDEIQTLEELINEIPREDIIDRKSMESQKNKLVRELHKLRRGR